MSLTRVSAQKAVAGFTLIELVLTIVILGFSVMILIPFFSSITHSPDPVLREKALALGQAMMDEILAKKWDENTPVGGGPICTGESPSQATRPTLIDACVTQATPVASLGLDGTETRVNYNDVDDYNYYDTHLETDTFTDQNGNSFTLLGYTRKVSVRYIASNTTTIDQNTAAALGTTDTKLVVVKVTSPLNEDFYFVAVVCNI